MKQADKTYMKNFSLSMVLYTITLLGSVYFLSNNEVAMWLKVLLVLVPVLPTLMALRALLIFSRSWDELQRQQAMEAVLIAFLLVAFGTFAYGFLEGIGFPKLDTVFILPMMVGAWGIGRAVTAGKYK
ncbi:hypothetical protein [Kordiimonas aestuarii]|uniref:hypothetical protein n=1 Tax=Kordiimonas aestuarii TaxID=1005925 RepID=UPI0021CFEA47|nr:hypothetical protein [Kordiimonas aestuarii]